MTSKDTETEPSAPAAAAEKQSKPKKRVDAAAASETAANAATATAPAKERIAKAMARVGLCSRREAEDWITAGRVSVNGTVLTTPAVTVGPSDRVVVDGATLISQIR